jgi:hypothetical protein
MDWKTDLLAQSGYVVVDMNGTYCRAFHLGAEVLLRWDGERWLVLN